MTRITPTPVPETRVLVSSVVKTLCRSLFFVSLHPKTKPIVIAMEEPVLNAHNLAKVESKANMVCSAEMQQGHELNAHNKEEYPPMHTAEHILNQTMVRMFGCPRSRNAHIERKKSKCDYQLVACPTDEQVQELERRVNEVIAQHLPVSYEFVKRGEVPPEVDLGKLPDDASETLRLVRIGDYDLCACVGTHVQNTSEIGTFKIISHDYNEEAHTWRMRFKLVE